MAKVSRWARWGERLRWALLGALVLGGPTIGLWIFLSAFPRMQGTKTPQPLADAAWLKHRRSLDVDDLWDRPGWLDQRIHFDHGLQYWLECRESAPVVTAMVRGRYSDSQLRRIAQHAASLAFFTFRGAKRSLTVHLWNESVRPGGRLEVRHATATLSVTLRDDDGSTDWSAKCDATVAPSVFARGALISPAAASGVGY